VAVGNLDVLIAKIRKRFHKNSGEEGMYRMRLELVWKCARAAVVECRDGSLFATDEPGSVFVNGVRREETSFVVSYLDGLEPSSHYVVAIRRGGQEATVEFDTDAESCTLDVTDFGAYGDDDHDDTIAIQAAIMACPEAGRVLIPAGTYKVTSIFLTSGLSLELAKGATLSASTRRVDFPIFPGAIERRDGCDDELLGTWEGESSRMFCGVITGVRVHDVRLYGRGLIDGNASFENWWHDAKRIRVAARPRMIFLDRCENVDVVGITTNNSPSWQIHPYFSRHLNFIALQVLGPKVSPNTDGLDPESCDDVNILGCYFSVGDDCIAVKSGKLSMPERFRVPCSNVTIRQCCMRDGHGSITLGSEMAGGIKDFLATDCVFLHTDRGLRVKTRRGRGKDAIVAGVTFENIKMDGVLTPFVVNSFYNCDPDGHTDYVQSRKALPVDERTPSVRSLAFKNIEATNCEVCAAFLTGLPEMRIDSILMKHVHVDFAADARPGVPAMMDGIGGPHVQARHHRQERCRSRARRREHPRHSGRGARTRRCR
jgi:polygalacturonase